MWKLLGLFFCFLTFENVCSLQCYNTPDRAPPNQVTNTLIPCPPTLKNPICYNLINYTVPDGHTQHVSKGCKNMGDCKSSMDIELKERSTAESKKKPRPTAIECIECQTDKCNADNKVPSNKIYKPGSSATKFVLLNSVSVASLLFIFLF